MRVTHVLLEEVKATVTGHEGCDLLAVLDQLDADRLTDSRVRLLGLNSPVNMSASEQRDCLHRQSRQLHCFV